MTRFAEVPDLVLGPLAGRPEADWFRAPAGRWCPAQIVHHLALSIEGSGRTFEARRGHAPMRRRPRTLLERLADLGILRLGWNPPGLQSPAAVRPAERPEPAVVARQLREGVARFLALERDLLPARASDLFVKHPRLGDLTLPEWLRFHVVHCGHHATQIRARLVA
ncbi:MAG TPA: DinB family protein [Gemmatimonadales bacterium]|nr:DinB family protein [Gemmatimonadales bacterium]